MTQDTASEPGYMGTQSLGAITFDGASKNYKPVMIFEYYATLRIVEKDRHVANTILQHRSSTKWLLSYVTDVDRHKELEDQLELDYQRNIDALVAKKIRLLKNPEFNEENLDKDDKLLCFSDACDAVIYEIQRFMNSAVGLVKERGIGVAFPWAAGGRFTFPMSLVPPDGRYQNVDTKRVYELRLWSTLMRTRAGAIQEDEREDDIQDEETLNDSGDNNTVTDQVGQKPV